MYRRFRNARRFIEDIIDWTQIGGMSHQSAVRRGKPFDIDIALGPPRHAVVLPMLRTFHLKSPWLLALPTYIHVPQSYMLGVLCSAFEQWRKLCLASLASLKNELLAEFCLAPEPKESSLARVRPN